MEEWDIISPKDVIGSEQLIGDRARSLAATALPFTQALLAQVADEVPHPVGHLFYQPLSAALTQVNINDTLHNLYHFIPTYDCTACHWVDSH